MNKQSIEIILICKGWYNKELYKTTLEAFNTYYHKYYGCEDIIMTKEFATELFLKPILEQIMKDEKFNSTSFLNDCLFSKFHENLYDKIVGWVGALYPIRHYDLSEYEEMFKREQECEYGNETIGII